MLDPNATSTGAAETTANNLSSLSIADLRARLEGSGKESEEAEDDATPVAVVEKKEVEPSGAAKAAGSTAAESDTAKTPEQEDAEDAEAEKAGKPVSQRGINRKFAKMSGKIRELEAQLAAKPAAAAEPKGVATPPAADPNEPKEADFETYPEYLRALTRYEVRRDREEAQAKDAQEQQVTAWEGRLKAAQAKYPDFEDVVIQPETEIKVSRAVEMTILESEYGPDIAYYLAKNPAEVERINKLAPLAAAAALGRIEATFTKAPEKQPTPAAAAKPLPKPPAQVDGTSSATPDLNDPDIPFETYKKLFDKKLKRAD